ncbi:predicted protein [Haematococcus lacustris]|uniref:Uncharacterized protein n=2 Tax=Haematococcus lacustris TaxID=44745 RepID=A0A699ZUI6_HAELA|nr:predicted protein [Haematococcus lacustris]
MGRCPFGFTADDEGEQAASEDETGSVAETHPAHPTQPASDAPGTSVKKSRKRAPTTFDIDKDPVSWFYQNQIKCEEEFQAKKDALREEARKRLDQIMDKKNKRLMWPSDSEFDDLSISSGELSELDSDVHSLTSLRSCALSWLENSKYGRPAEACLRWAALAGLAASGIGMILSYVAVKAGQKVQALAAWGPGASHHCLWGHSFHYRHAVGASHRGKKERAMKLCQLLPIVKAEAAESGANLLWGLVVMGLLALVLLAVGAWYTLELCFIEKKAVKHVRRHKRHKQTIPWEKIKIIGPVTNCGANKMAAASKKGGGGKCPVMAAKDKEA